MQKHRFIKAPSPMTLFATWLCLLGMLFGVVTLPIGALPVEKMLSHPDEEITTPTPTATTTTAIPPSSLVAYLVSGQLTQTERDWLDREAPKSLTANFAMSYDSTIHSEYVTLTANGQSLKVTAAPYVGDTYNTLWTPTSVTYQGETYPLTQSQSTYTATIPLVENDTIPQVSVTYQATLTLPEADRAAYQSLVNGAYQAAEDGAVALAVYQENLTAYQKQQAAYTAYQAALRTYKADLALYQAYLSEMQAYEQKMQAYEQYQKALTAYQQENDAYLAYLEDKKAYDEAYATYMAFLHDPAAYEQTYLAYVAYQKNVAKVQAQVAILDSFFVADSKGNVMNATLNGPTVATVVQNKNELVAAGCNETDINHADEATAKLIALLKEYPVKGSLEEKYAYYIQYAEDYREQVTLLYTSLSRLYENDGVPDILKMKGKLERYWQFVAQLYVLSCCLDDHVMLDRSWHISEGQLLQLLEACFLLEDTNEATPLTQYPAEIEPVTPPAELTMPTPPDAVTKPTAPLPVAKPTQPHEVMKPVMPQAVTQPGDPPTMPLLTALELSLVDEVETGKLSKRTLSDLPGTWVVTQNVDKAIAVTDTPVALFYDADGMTLLEVVSANAQGVVTLPQDLPTRPSNEGKAYTFDGWQTQDGSVLAVDTTQIHLLADGVFCATYTTQDLTYQITFLIEGQAYTQTYTYGETPVYEGIPQKPQDQQGVYAFVGYSPAVVPVTQDAVYEAVFCLKSHGFVVTWVVGDVEENDVYGMGEMPKYPYTPDSYLLGDRLYVFKEWTPHLTPVYEDVTYHAVFEALPLMPQKTDTQGVSATEDSQSICVTIEGLTWQNPQPTLWDISYLAPLAVAKDKRLTLQGENLSLTLATTSLQTLVQAGAVWIEVSYTQNQWQITALDASRQPLSVDVPLSATLQNPTYEKGVAYDREGEMVSSTQDGKLCFVMTTGEAYVMYWGQPVTIQQTQGGVCTTPSPLATAGQTLTLVATPAPGYGVSGVEVQTLSEAAVDVTATQNQTYTFVMPDEGVTVTPVFEKLVYTVVFKVDGQVIHTKTYHYGETPTPPTPPTKESDGQYRYTFSGWHTPITPVMGDMVYEAVFVATPLSQEPWVEDSGIGFVELLFIGMATFVMAVGCVLVPYLVVRHRKARKDK